MTTYSKSKKYSIEEALLIPTKVRFNLRFNGYDIPVIPKEYRKNWNTNPTKDTGRQRANRWYKNIGVCSVCGFHKSERHHKDANPTNNSPENIEILCRQCHMKKDGRWEIFIKNASLGSKSRWGSVKTLTFKGETKTLFRWSKEFNIGPNTVSLRLKMGWPVEKALTQKPRKLRKYDRK